MIMNDEEIIEIAKDNLSRILNFFPRTDTLLSVILAINLGLLAILTANAPPLKSIDGFFIFVILFLLLIFISFYHLYKCAFPQLEGGHTSLIYFREIANKTQIEFSDEFNKQTKQSYITDLTEQIWINSKILSNKYYHLRMAFIFLLLSVIFWLPSLLNFISRNTESLLRK